MTETFETRVLLLVEDNPGDAQLVLEYLSEVSRDRYEVVQVPRLEDAIARIASTAVDVILLDLGLPDCRGIESVQRLHDAANETPIVVLTGDADRELALACIDAGAQDFLEKNEIGSQNLRRAIGYAITRQREAQLREMQRVMLRFRELSSMNRTTSVTASLAGSGAIKDRAPENFNTLVARYFALLEPHLEGGSIRLTPSRTEMEYIATILGDANAGPRDLLDVHVAALERATNEVDAGRSRLLVLETRLLALQMMGLLVDYYRVGHRRRFLGGDPK